MSREFLLMTGNRNSLVEYQLDKLQRRDEAQGRLQETVSLEVLLYRQQVMPSRTRGSEASTPLALRESPDCGFCPTPAW